MGLKYLVIQVAKNPPEDGHLDAFSPGLIATFLTREYAEKWAAERNKENPVSGLVRLLVTKAADFQLG